MVDVPGNATTDRTISVGGSITDTLEVAGDHDWYRIDLIAGQKVTIAVNLLTLEDSYIYLRNSSGAVLLENDDGGGGRGSRLVFTAPTTGTYYIDVGAWTPTEPVPGYTGTGSYRLSVSNYVAPSVGTLDEIAYQMTNGFFGGESHHFDVTQGGTITVDLTGLTVAGRNVALQALQQWTDIIGVNFVQQTGGAQITFDDLQQGTGAFADATYANGITTSAIVNVAVSRLNLHTYMHEIGHALGIGHTSNSNAGTAAAVYPDDAIWSNDGAAISIMSYFDNGENAFYADQGFSNVPILTPQVADIIAMGNLYGLSTTTRVGNTTYGFNNNSGRSAFDATLNPSVSYTIFDSGGIDTLDYSGFASNQRINLNAEAFSNVGSLVGNVVIARGTVIENAIGGSGADTIIGNFADNVLTGNGGPDQLTGGGGNDTFRGTKLGLNGDTITDFNVGDRVVITDATLAGFTFNITGSTLNFTGGSLSLTQGSSGGTLVASAAAGGGVQLTMQVRDVADDFNGDGRSDILWRHESGLVTTWLGTFTGGMSIENPAGFFANPGNDWQVGGVGDFNGDTRDDILWRHSSGVVTDWLGTAAGGMNVNNAANLFANPGNDWQVVGIGDFNGDTRDDILWRHSTGVVTDWLGTEGGGMTTDNAANLFANPGSDWQVGGVGDFNGDGRDDLLWRHSSGVVTNWLGTAAGGMVTDNAANFFANPGTDWQVAGVGDFNGDGRDDILWRHSSGVVTDWFGTASGGMITGDFFANPGTEWRVANVGDFNGDGRDDILWRHASGAVTDWLGTASGGMITNNAANFFAIPGVEWQVDPDSLL